MPSAANVKIEKQIASENALPEATHSSPLRQAITVIEHKIRNLEKRKSKLESYRDLQRSGKDLNQDQKTAVSKYDEVVQTLEFARDLCKQFLGIALVSEKEDKKRARKEANARSQAELTKIREVLLVQDALTNMGQDTIREDFLNGRNGAATLCPNDLKLLDDLYSAVTPKHEAGDPTAFMPQVQAAAEHLLGVVDGKPKEAFGATYNQIKEVIGKIHESGYLDQAVEPYTEECVVPPTEPAQQQQQQQPPQQQPEVVNQMNMVEAIPVQQLESMNINMQEQQQQVPVPQQAPPQMEPPVQMQPVPEQIYYQPAPPAPRPISEVLGTGSFFFIQADELDTPPEQIPSQTFTNQTYVTAPPPPIPMPPHFHQFPNAQPPPPQQQQQQPPPPQQQPQQPPQNVIPPQQQQQPPQQQQQQPAQVNAPMQANNGIGDHHPETQQHDEVRQHQQQQRGGNRHPQQRANNQPFFTNNNGYNNRPRNRNNGPRPNNNRNTQQ